jgi:methanogenic corrinoid protein MtbC1
MVDQQSEPTRLQDHQPGSETLMAPTALHDPTRSSIVSRIIEMEIVPGLISRSRQFARPAGPAARTNLPQSIVGLPIALQVSSEMVEELTNLTIAGDAAVCQVYVDQLSASGLEHRSLFSNLFANVARLLGRRWEDDTCTFFEVTIGLAALHQLVRINAAPASVMEKGADVFTPRILLLPAPGEQHVFGLLILADSLTASGYDVDVELDVTESDDVTRIVKERPCECVSLSCSNDRCLDGLSESVSKLRAARDFGQRPIVIGGPAIQRAPHLVTAFGADDTADDETGFAVLLDRLLFAHGAPAKTRQLVGTAQ